MVKSKQKATSHWLILVILALAQFMVVLDVAIVNVMLPTVQHSFHMSETSLSWVVTAYTLTFGGFLLLGGRAADLFGRRRVFLTGVSAFAFVSLLDGLSQSGGMLISLRAAQGLCAAFMSPAALSIVLVTFKEGHERNVALSVWGAVASGGAAVGLFIGGLLTQYAGWRWNFFINVPIGIFVVIMAARLVPKHEGEETDSNLDLLGAVSVTASLISLVYALVKAPSIGWTNHTTLLYLGIFVALMVIFIINETRVKHPIMPLRIFKIRNLVGADIAQVAVSSALFSVFFFSSLYLQEILKYSPSRTGFAFLAVPFAIAITATNVPRLIKKVGAKRVIMVAPLVTAVGLLMLSRITVNGGYFEHILPGMVVMGLGLGATFVSIIITATTGVAKHLSGLASGLINTAQQVGGSLGLAIITGIVASTTTAYITHHGVGAHPSQLLIAQANVHSFRIGYTIAACFSVFASLVAAVVIKHKNVTDTTGEVIPEI